MGTGGIGGYFGARLAASGCDVGFVARGEHLRAMRENGLKVESDLGNVQIANPRISDNPEALGRADVVLFCVKLWDTETAARAIAPVVGPNTAVISLQNGVQKEDQIRRSIPRGNLVGGLCYIGSRILSPGVIQHTGKLQRLVIGEFDGTRTDRVQALLGACLNGGINAEISDDIQRAIWEKFVFLVAVSGATTTMRSPIGPIRENPQTRQFLLGLMREVVAVGRARGIQLDPDFADRQLAFCDTLAPEMVSSMYNDLRGGKRLELDWLSGGVVDLAGDVETPLNRAVRDVLVLHAKGEG
jgi:2-dehydropantoate 2-reductase